MADTSLVGSLTYGLVGTLHCAAMCGPLALAAAQRPVAEGASASSGRWKEALGYHSGRAASYLALGALFGGLGGGLHLLTGLPVGKALPFVLAAMLVATAFDLFRFLPVPRPLLASLRGVWSRARHSSPLLGAVLVGAATALLPCGLLWGSLPVAAASGSPLSGAAHLAAFAIGSAPTLLLVQLQAGALLRRLGPSKLLWAQRFLAVGAAAFLVVHALMRASAPAPCCHH